MARGGLSYEVRGSGDPLVLIHGLTHRRQAWYPVLEHLTDSREVILIDLPGHGESPDLVVENGDLQGTIRARLSEMIDAIGLDRPHIGGNSLGGRIALEAAADGLARSATALSPAAFWYGSLDVLYLRTMFSWLTASASLMAPVIPVLARSGAARSVMGAMIAAHPARIDPGAFVADVAGMRRAVPAMRQIFPAAEPFDREIPADVRVTIAWGARDLILLPFQARLAVRRMPHADHVRLSGRGHVPMADDPAAVARVLLRGSAGSSSASVVGPIDPGAHRERPGR